jgi:aminoglycoside phosphotransferase (APT) family kinase protein
MGRAQIPVGTVLTALASSRFSSVLRSVERIQEHGLVYPDLFRIGNDPAASFIVKVRTAGAQYLTDALECFKWIRDEADLLEQYLDVVEADGYWFFVTRWIDGIQPTESHRSRIKDFFPLLAKLHLANRCTGPVTSMYADGAHFGSCEEMIDAEVSYHLGFFDLDDLREACVRAIDRCKDGLSCAVHEDVHPGNMMVACNGPLKLIDCEWVHRGLNLHQFLHMDYFAWQPPQRFRIQAEARECYRAYFDALGIGASEANEQIRGSEMLAVLRQNTYWRFYKQEEHYSKTQPHARQVLEQDTFI